MSAENHNPSSPAGGGTDGATEASNHAPESVRPGIVASHGEREKRAYVAPVEIPKRHQRTATIDMSKVRISPDMKVQQLDPRNMQTVKMDIPPGGIRPPPPPATAEVADVQSSRPQPLAQDAGASPWSQNAGIDRSMLPSAAMAPSGPAQGARHASAPPPRGQTSSGVSPWVWIGVILVAALLGGGIALALRNNASSGSADPAASSAPIAITVPNTTPPTTDTADTADTDDEAMVVEPNGPDAKDTANPSTKTTTPRTVPRRTSPAPKSTTPSPAPAPTTTAPPRLFN